MPTINDIGEQIDGSFASYYDANKHADTQAETVDVVDDRIDGGNNETSFIPSHIDESVLTDTERKVIETCVLNPNASRDDIAEMVGCSQPMVSTTANEYLDDNRANDPDEGQGKYADNYDQLTDARKRVVDAFCKKPSATQAEIAEKANVSVPTVQNVATQNKAILRSEMQARVDEAQESEFGTEESEVNPETELEVPESAGDDGRVDEVIQLTDMVLRVSNNEETKNLAREVQAILGGGDA